MLPEIVCNNREGSFWATALLHSYEVEHVVCRKPDKKDDFFSPF